MAMMEDNRIGRNTDSMELGKFLLETLKCTRDNEILTSADK